MAQLNLPGFHQIFAQFCDLRSKWIVLVIVGSGGCRRRHCSRRNLFLQIFDVLFRVIEELLRVSMRCSADGSERMVIAHSTYDVRVSEHSLR